MKTEYVIYEMIEGIKQLNLVNLGNKWRELQEREIFFNVRIKRQLALQGRKFRLHTKEMLFTLTIIKVQKMKVNIILKILLLF